MDDKKTLDSLKNGLAAYEKIVDKEIHYIYLKNGQYHEVVFKAHKKNFMHLCGVSYKDPKTGQIMSASQFYKALKKKKISPIGIKKKVDGTSDLKLNVLDQLNDLTTCNLRIIDETTTFLNLTFDKGIRSKRQIFCLSLESVGSGVFVPTSLLNLKTNKGSTIKSGHPVHCIYSVNSITKDIHILSKSSEFIQYEKTNSYPYKTVPLTVRN